MSQMAMQKREGRGEIADVTKRRISNESMGQTQWTSQKGNENMRGEEVITVKESATSENCKSQQSAADTS
jgi:hypothetical protein